MSKAIAVGEKHLILGFKAMGFEIIALEDNAKLMQTLIAISSDLEVGLVVVTESMAEGNQEAINEFQNRSSAVITLIPTHEGSRHTSFFMMSRAVERSIGIDILGKDINKKD